MDLEYEINKNGDFDVEVAFDPNKQTMTVTVTWNKTKGTHSEEVDIRGRFLVRDEAIIESVAADITAVVKKATAILSVNDKIHMN